MRCCGGYRISLVRHARTHPQRRVLGGSEYREGRASCGGSFTSRRVSRHTGLGIEPVRPTALSPNARDSHGPCLFSTHVLSADVQVPESVRTPSVAGWLKDVALRDLGLHEQHGACIDARGDVYQWGDGFFGTHPADAGAAPSSSGNPVLTLRGKVCQRVHVHSSICP